MVSMVVDEHRDPFSDLMSFLVEAGKLEKTDAAIYVLGLRKGTITSGDLIEARIVPRQTTAADHLRKLCNAGYFETLITEESRRGRGRARKFKATPPEIVLKDLLEMYQGVNQVLEKIKEHREVLSESSEVDDDIWLLRPQKVVMQQVAAMIQGAKRSIKIYGHDCTWFNEAALSSAIGKAHSKKVKICVFATDPSDRIVNGLKKIGVDLAQTDLACVPFCLIDDSILLLPCKGGVFANEYFVISTRQKYLVDNFVEMFKGMQKPKS